ncbi:hypothetical protein J6590_100584, partial [Homalodisca vitripennis]
LRVSAPRRTASLLPVRQQSAESEDTLSVGWRRETGNFEVVVGTPVSLVGEGSDDAK